MARKKTASTRKRPPAEPNAGAGPAPRQRGHRSIVTKRDLVRAASDGADPLTT